ncbi:MAG: hypothetical protein HY873_12355 [Chloroflexi bacterium]|nr:hypothetical protein [Chloroflexota bacterium]
MSKAWIATLIALALAASACEQRTSTQSTSIVPLTPTSVAEAQPTASVPPPERPASFDAYAETIASYLSESPGAASDCLADVLGAWAMPLVETADGCLAGNADDDPDSELLLVISSPLEPPSATSDTRYRIVVLDTSAAGYGVAFQSESFEAVPPGTTVLAPLLAVEDLNGDGTGEFAYKTGYCGASACFDTAFIYTGSVAGYDLISPRDGIGVGEGSFEFRDTDGDGSQELLASGGISGSVGAGPQRSRTETWAWDGSLYALRSTEPGPSPYLYHHIADADAVLAAGNYALAEQMYLLALLDGTLEAYYPDRHELEELRSYGLFRAALAHLLSGGDAETATGYLNSAREGEQTLHAQLAASFQAGFAAKSEVSVGCAAVRDDLRANEPEYAAFWDFGYANPAFNAATFCPF